MVVIRLSRGGSKGRPFFNIVVSDKRVRRDQQAVLLGAAEERVRPRGPWGNL